MSKLLLYRIQACIFEAKKSQITVLLAQSTCLVSSLYRISYLVVFVRGDEISICSHCQNIVPEDFIPEQRFDQLLRKTLLQISICKCYSINYLWEESIKNEQQNTNNHGKIYSINKAAGLFLVVLDINCKEKIVLCHSVTKL